MNNKRLQMIMTVNFVVSENEYNHDDKDCNDESAIEYIQQEGTQTILLFKKKKKMVKHFSTEKHYNM